MKPIKTVKALLFTLIMSFFVIGTIAFAKEVMKKENVEQVKLEPAKKLVFQTWRFTSAVNNDPANPLNYALEQSLDPPCSSLEEKICRISAPDDGNGHPDLQELVYDAETSMDQTIEFLIDRANASLSTSSPTLNAAVTAFTKL